MPAASEEGDAGDGEAEIGAHAVDQHRHETDAEHQADDRPDQSRRCLEVHRLLPRQAARRDEHPAQRPSGEGHAEQTGEDGDPTCAVGLRQGDLDLRRHRAGQPGVVDLALADRRGEEPGQADDEQQEGDEEQEQPEGDGAADDRPGALPVPLEDAQADVDEVALE